MNRFYLLVEGQTEETFVRELLVPHYAPIGLYITPIIVNTSSGHKGGVVSYAKIKPQLIRLCRQNHSACVSTLFDLYALPKDFPGKASSDYPVNGSGQQKADFLERMLAQDISEANFIPNLMVHEFESFLFVQPERFGDWMSDIGALANLSAIAAAHATPEDINDSPQGAPSKRVLSAIPTYQKTFHGPLIACEIGLDAIREACPHFHNWLQKLETLTRRLTI